VRLQRLVPLPNVCRSVAWTVGPAGQQPGVARHLVDVERDRMPDEVEVAEVLVAARAVDKVERIREGDARPSTDSRVERGSRA
jgi:hypothetical protein